ncbi:MAG: ATP-binding protein [Candidatus Heimdallarchaeota archaeon]
MAFKDGQKSPFPFSAIVGNEKVKLALILNVIDPTIGGVLLRGPKGTGKSIAVRALPGILPTIRAISDCPFHCSPNDRTNQCSSCNSKENPPIEEKHMRITTLPLGATEDRLIGSIDIERIIQQGIEAFEPGILAEANQGVLYIDEINLLADHLIDDLLDSAASGWNYVEREGVSVSHPARFVLIGSMNPEEGDLRPQLLDRLALHVATQTSLTPEKRAEIIKRNLEYSENPQGYLENWAKEELALLEQIKKARRSLSQISVTQASLELIGKLCSKLRMDGYRPDIVLTKAARAMAAYHEEDQVRLEHIKACANLVLTHRTREGGYVDPPSRDDIEEVFKALEKQG